MRSINLIIIGLLLWAVACEDETFEFDHPLDSHTGEVPALIFNPDSINILYGESAVVGIYVLQAEGVSGVHAQVHLEALQPKAVVHSVSELQPLLLTSPALLSC